MSEPIHHKVPRNNPFWTYRDPLSGRWMTLMTAAQCQQLSNNAFVPKTRRSPTSEQDSDDPSGRSVS